MNINIIKLVYLLLGLMLALESFALELFKGDSRVGNTFSDQETAMKILKIGAVGMSGFVSTNSDKFYYVLIGTIVGKVDVQNEAYLEGWPLTPYAEAITLNGERAAKDRYLGNYGVRS